MPVTISTQRAVCYPIVGKRPLPVSSDMTRLRSTSKTAGLAAAFSLVLLAGSALAQEERGSGNFLDNLFSRGEPSAQSRQSAQPAPSGRVAQSDPGDLSVRLDRMENALRQLTGTIEQLQYRNQQLEMQIQQLGARGGGVLPPQAAPAGPGNAPPGNKSRPALRCFRSVAKSGCARRAANAGQSGGHRRARTHPGQRITGRCPRRTRSWCAARSVDDGRQRCTAAAAGRSAAQGGRFSQRHAGAGITADASTDAAAASPECGPGPCRRAACNLAAVGLAAGRIRHGVRLRAA